MKTLSTKRRPTCWVPPLFAVMAIGGCGGSDAGVYEVEEPPEGQAQETAEVAAFDPTDAMTLAIQDEYRARATYAKVLAELGDITPFSNIVEAEARHVEAIAGLFTNRDLAVPASEWDESNVPTFLTRAEACAAGVAAEIAHAAMYDELLLLDLPDDVQTVFGNLRAASLEQHLPAFEKCVLEEQDDGEDPEVPAFDPTDAMTLAIQDEYRARATYAKVLTDLGDITPFSNIVEAEARHVEAVAGLFTNRDLAVPASEWDESNVPTFLNRAEACAAGVAAEVANVAMYDEFLLLDLPDDVQTVFGNLRLASLDNHLPAFEKCVLEEQDDGVDPDPPAFDPTDAMTTAIQDEYRARATYAKVLTDLGDITPFSNIVEAEARHVEAIAGLFTNRDLAVPASEWDDSNVATFATRAQACAAGVAAEIANVAMYDEFLLLALPDDVQTVFGNLRLASLDNHLPAFEKCVLEEQDDGVDPDPPAFDPTDAMTTAIQDEYRARATYAKVLTDLGDITPFSNIVEAEARHVEAIAGLFTTRSLAVPASEWDETNVATLLTRAAACAGGVTAETNNVALYDGLLLLDLPDDVRTVFGNLRSASLDQHLPAFEKCS